MISQTMKKGLTANTFPLSRSKPSKLVTSMSVSWVKNCSVVTWILDATLHRASMVIALVSCSHRYFMALVAWASLPISRIKASSGSLAC